MEFQLQPPQRAKGYAVTHATTDHATTPARGRAKSAETDPEVVAFRQNFETDQPPANPLDQLVREGARQMLQAAIAGGMLGLMGAGGLAALGFAIALLVFYCQRGDPGPNHYG